MRDTDIVRPLRPTGIGSHRPYKHPSKNGRFTAAGKPGNELAPVTVNSILKQAALRATVMRYAVVIEQAANNFSAYVSDLPGCVAMGKTREKVAARIRDAIAFHLDGLRADGHDVPPPTSKVAYVDIEAWGRRHWCENGIEFTYPR